MRRIVLALAAFGALLVSGGVAQAHGWHGHFHRPSVHYHTYFHPTYTHWTPYKGWHTHGHYHVTPHFTPGHVHW